MKLVLVNITIEIKRRIVEVVGKSKRKKKKKKKVV
jgi:hypothetical protein